jgi:hypothetical protein
MSDAISHPSHRSADSCSTGGLGGCWSHPSGPTLSRDVLKPFRTTFRTSVALSAPVGLRSCRVRYGVEPEIGGQRHPRAESSEYRGVCAGSSLLTCLGL